MRMQITSNLATNVGTLNDTNRDSWVQDALAIIPAGARLLDAGAGDSSDIVLFASHLRYVSHDFCQYDGTGDGKALQSGNWDTCKIDLVSDIIEIPAEDQSFDAILCTEVLEHVPDPVAALESSPDFFVLVAG